jgi:hypothetical protein
MRIGISVLTHGEQNIWENGLGQNVLLLADLLASIPFVQSVILLDCGDQGQLPPQVGARERALPLMKPAAAGDLVDVIIEMAGGLDVAWLDLMRARGKKVVFHCCGQPYVSLVEPIVFNRQPYAARYERCDEVWYLSKDTQHAPLLRMMFRCDAYEVPFLWDARFVRMRMEEIAPLGFHFGFRDQEGGGFRVAIFEPNVSVVKAASIPMLVCEEAYRLDSQAVQAMHVLNTLHMTEHRTLLHMANSLDLVQQHRATFHGRHDVVGFMAQHANAVVAHQWNNEQNYAYLDALFGDYPLVHNSPWLREAGYYYPDFDIEAGAAALARAVREHSRSLESYRARSHDVFAKVSPASRLNSEAYARRLWRLVKGRVSVGAA